MSDETETVELPVETLDRLRTMKGRLDAEQPGVPDHSLASYVEYLLDTATAARTGYYADMSEAVMVAEVSEDE